MMTDIPADAKLDEFSRAWRDADDHYNADIIAAKDDKAQQGKIEANWWRHQANWAGARVAELDKNSAAITAAYDSAKKANDTVTKARTDAQAIAALITKSSAAADALTGLLKAVHGA